MNGLPGSHAFTILGMHEIKGEKVLNLRNPWGVSYYCGDWSDYSYKWTEDLKKQYDFAHKKDGDFFIGYEDFLEYFKVIGICKLHPEFISSRIKVKKYKAIKCQLIKITIPEDNTLVYFQLYTKNPRIPNKKDLYVYPKEVLCNLILADKDFNYLNASAGKNHICIENTLKKGIYYLFCDANYRYDNDMKKHGYTITAYSGINIPMENITDNDDVPYLLRKVVIDYCKKKGELEPQDNGVNLYITKPFDKDIPYRAMAFENLTDKDCAVNIEVKYKKDNKTENKEDNKEDNKIDNKKDNKGGKRFCFYCDDDATENYVDVIKIIKAKETKVVIIMNYSLSSVFSVNGSFIDAEGIRDPVYNHCVFDAKGVIHKNKLLKHYLLQRTDKMKYYLGIENLDSKRHKIQLVLNNLRVDFGVYEGKDKATFELNGKERKVFNVLNYGSGEETFDLSFVD